MSERKPKFRVGQIVANRDTGETRVLFMRGKVTNMRKSDAGGWVVWLDNGDIDHESNFRALTKRERSPQVEPPAPLGQADPVESWEKKEKGAMSERKDGTERAFDLEKAAKNLHDLQKVGQELSGPGTAGEIKHLAGQIDTLLDEVSRLRKALKRAEFLVHRELCSNVGHHPECRLIMNALKGHAENCNSVLFSGAMGECDCKPQTKTGDSHE